MKELNILIKQIRNFFKIKNNNELIKLMINIILLYLILKQKYYFECLLLFIFIAVISYKITKNLMNSLLISLFSIYIILTFFYKIKFENFKNHYNKNINNQNKKEKIELDKPIDLKIETETKTETEED